MAHPVTVPSNLPDLVRTVFARAQTAGDLTFFPTQVALLRVNDIPFQLRFAPSLAKKPKPPKTAAATTGSQPAAARFDPFADPSPGLLVLPQLGSSSAAATHRLVLNKFAICRDHAILATTDFRPQDHLLAADDLATAYACIEAYHASPSGSEELFIFYNSGAHSGASQPHRHLQMLPVARMREGLEGDEASAWNVLADQLLQRKNSRAAAGFYVAVAPVRQDGHATPSAEALHALYLHLYRQACAAAGLTGGDASAFTTTEEEEGRIPARLSYNLALTRTTMALCPRTAEGGSVSAQGATAGSLSLNGTLLAGTALVKNEAEWTALRQDPGQLAQVLRQIGVPPFDVSL